MDVQRPTRERVFSILNDNDSPSFAIRKSSQPSISPKSIKLPSICLSPRPERPNLLRHPEFHRTSSISSVGSPPLLRYDSSSSTKSSSSRSMDSTPSPITPAYNYNETNLTSYDNLLRQDVGNGFIPSPSTITPFMEQQMMIAPVPGDIYAAKAMPALIPSAYPVMPPQHADLHQMPTPALSANASVSSNSSANPQSKTSPVVSNGAPPVKKNKYPCPYAQSHNCSATFTTSGHAARHGKKHTGEKGVHCPVCDKAFTRKDNMKQHERTHKNQGSNPDDRRSKAAVTREAQKTKINKKSDQNELDHLRKSSAGLSEPSDITLAPNPVETPVNIQDQFYPDPTAQGVLGPDAALTLNPGLTGSLYPPLGDENILGGLPNLTNDKMDGSIPPPPALIRGFSDLDTLAQAAESFDPYFQQTQF